MPLTNAEKQKAHRRRMAEKMARYEGALREIDALADLYATDGVMSIVGAITDAALNPIPAVVQNSAVRGCEAVLEHKEMVG